jgi:lipopolysaccharide export LptBFGC system permease protein LptF
MAYEIYYAFVMTSTDLEFAGFVVWFLMDATFAAIAIYFAYPPEKRGRTAVRMVLGVLVGVAFFHALCAYFPDEREQLTAYWTGWLLETPIGWGELWHLLKRGDTKGQSLEIWFVHVLPFIYLHQLIVLG